MIHSIELLSPAGNEEKLKYAIAYGADAVYAGFPKFSLRARENDFNNENLAASIDYSHKRGKKIYITLNIYPHNRKLPAIKRALTLLKEIQPDGVIISDPGVINLAHNICPSVPLHLSTQANAVNWLSVKFWKNAGVQRIILPRELSIDEIAEIREKVPDIELECFVHGSICIAYSGRCLISNYLTHRDSNQGICTNSCRWAYRIMKEERYFLEETKRPGEFMPIEEDEHGSYLMNAKDMCALDVLPQLMSVGINSIKIEGRTKSLYYVSVITKAYRHALNAVANGKSIPEICYKDIYSVSNRGYIKGFNQNEILTHAVNYDSPQTHSDTYQFCGIVRDNNKKNGLSRISVRCRFNRGDELEMFTPSQQMRFKVNKLYNLNGEEEITVHGGGEDKYLELPLSETEYGLLRKPLNII